MKTDNNVREITCTNRLVIAEEAKSLFREKVKKMIQLITQQKII